MMLEEMKAARAVGYTLKAELTVEGAVRKLRWRERFADMNGHTRGVRSGHKNSGRGYSRVEFLVYLDIREVAGPHLQRAAQTVAGV